MKEKARSAFPFLDPLLPETEILRDSNGSSFFFRIAAGILFYGLGSEMAADAAFLLPAGNYGGLRRRLDLM
ncbi:hypothetical protein CGZ77_00430 [Neisseria sp. KEM232]|nr:hypothetical protein CGZ77_00430 [Neisseria sp. KEM232]